MHRSLTRKNTVTRPGLGVAAFAAALLLAALAPRAGTGVAKGPAPQGVTTRIDDYTEYTYVSYQTPLNSFYDLPVRRTFPGLIKSIKVTIVSGDADDVGYVGSLLVARTNPGCDGLARVLQPVDVTSQVAVGGNAASFLLRAQEDCLTNPYTGWGSKLCPECRNARFHWEVTLQGCSEMVDGVADLAVTQAAAPDPVPVGGDLTYTLTAKNNGPDPAYGVTLTDTLAGGDFAVVSAVTSSEEGSCDYTPPGGAGPAKLTCRVPYLPAGDSVTGTVVIRPLTPGTLTNTTAVAGGVCDLIQSNNTAVTTTRVLPVSDPAVTLSATTEDGARPGPGHERQAHGQGPAWGRVQVPARRLAPELEPGGPLCRAGRAGGVNDGEPARRAGRDV